MVKPDKNEKKAPCAIFILGRAFVRNVLTIRHGRIMFVCSKVSQKVKPKVMRVDSIVHSNSARYIGIRMYNNIKFGRNNEAERDREEKC